MTDSNAHSAAIVMVYLSLLFLSLQRCQPLLLFPLLLLQSQTSLLQLQVSSLKVLPLLILKGHCGDTKGVNINNI